MALVPARDLEGLLAFVGELHCNDAPIAFSTPLLDLFKELLPADKVSFSELDRARRRCLARVECSACEDEFPDELPELPTEFWEMCWNSAPSVHRRQTNEPGPLKLSDFFTRRQLHREAIYADLYRQWGVEDLLVIDLVPSHVHTRKIMIGNCTRDFGERDRRVAALLQPHLASAYRNAAKRRFLAAALSAAEATDHPVLLLGADGEPEFVTPAAHDLLEAWFGDDGRLPGALAEWHRHQPSARPFAVVRDGRRLVVELAGRRDALLLRVEAATASPLTPREHDVVLLVAAGKSNKEIARDLWVTPATVKKHLEHVYRKLGVRGRTAAAAKLGLLSAG